jgi:hypothetical protein
MIDGSVAHPVEVLLHTRVLLFLLQQPSQWKKTVWQVHNQPAWPAASGFHGLNKKPAGLFRQHWVSRRISFTHVESLVVFQWL